MTIYQWQAPALAELCDVCHKWHPHLIIHTSYGNIVHAICPKCWSKVIRSKQEGEKE